MKKITLLMLFLSSLWGYSQVNRYTFAQSTGTYAEISGATVLGGETNDTERFVDPTIPVGSTSVPGSATVLTGVGLPIGFNFTFNGYVYDKFAVATDGWISLGTAALGVNINAVDVTKPISSVTTLVTDVLSAKIAALGVNLKAQTGSSISYTTIGTSPNRTLVVQWKKYMQGVGGNATLDNFNFQIRLSETTNTVDVVYGTMICDLNGAALSSMVGMRGESTTNTTNYLNRVSTTGWNNSANGTATGSVIKIAITDATDFPASGFTFTWTPPTCGIANALVVSNVSLNGATLNWGSYAPAPDSYEYIVSLSPTVPLATVSGTTANSATATVTGLNSGPSYFVFLRTKCGSAFTPWVSAGTFRTLCPDATTFYEDFDSNTPFSNSTLADCWSKLVTGAGANYIVSGASAPMTAPNKLYLFGTASATAPGVGYAILPNVSNLSAGTNRLKFKGLASATGGGTVDIGYLTDITNASTFVPLVTKQALPGNPSTNAADIIYAPAAGAIPSGVKNLVIKNSGIGTTGLTVYIDNVAWEAYSTTCPDISALMGTKITDTSIALSWTNGGSETAWQYVIGAPTVKDPTTLAPVNISSNPFTVTGLNASTGYKVWVRAKCTGTDQGAWIGPLVFTTTCSAASQFMENFDASSSSLPLCWKGFGSYGLATTTGGSAPETLTLTGSPTSITIVALPPVSNTATNRLRFKAKGSVDGLTLDIGYLDDINDSTTFHSLQSVTGTTDLPTATFKETAKIFGAALQTPYLAFRSMGATAGTIMLDDIAWEPNNASCPDVTALTIATSTDTSGTVAWTAGANETAWQYAIGTATAASAYLSTPVDVASSPTSPSVTIPGLTPSTTYRVWIRSKCSGTSFGAWMGPINFTTTCTPITSFTEYFDTTANKGMPACWNKVGSNGAVMVKTGLSYSTGNSLTLDTTTSWPAICSILPVSNAGLGTYRLKFRFMTAMAIGTPLEVGFLNNPADPASFSSLKTVLTTQTTTFEAEQVVELGTDPLTAVLAFRNNTPGVFIYIDNVIWEPIPACADIKNLATTAVTDTSITLHWDAGGTETKWQYGIGATAPTGTAFTEVSASTATITALTANTAYQIWVRSKCSTYGLGTWIPISVNTVCTGVDKFTENFDASADLPNCWRNLGRTGTGIPAIVGVSTSGARVLNIFASSGTDQGIVSMPPVSPASCGDHVLKFKYVADAAGSVLEVGYITNPGNPTFVPFNSINIVSTTDFKLATISLGASPVSNILAFRNKGAVLSHIYIDDVSWEAVPTAVPPCTTATPAITNSCGNFATTISWPAITTSVDGYKLYVGTTSGGNDILNGYDTVALSYSLIANANTTYYYKVVPYNSIGDARDCVVQSYVTNATKCYCASVPPFHEGNGITNITLGRSSFDVTPDTKVSYFDFTSKPVNLARSADSNLAIRFDTNGEANNVVVYIDLNDNDNFESTEVFFTGPTLAPDLNHLNAVLSLPATASLGTHRMRISAYSVSNVNFTITPCGNNGSGEVADLTVNVVAPIANDEPANAIALTVGTNFASNAITGTDVDATGSVAGIAPACGGFNGMDVWYKAVVPSTGNLTFEVNTVSGGITNTAAAAYSGAVSSLALITCDDSSSVTGKGINGDQPKIGLTGRTAGEVIYFRVWTNGGNAFGTFKAAAYDAAVLGVNTFDDINFSYYPNPVTDALNLSFNQEMGDVSVVNLLGQQVISKTLNANQGKIDMSGLSRGAYLVKVTVGNQSKTIKVIKE